jgi:uncharacterized membrane protein
MAEAPQGSTQPDDSPTVPPRHGLAPAMERNIDAIVRRRREEARSERLEERVADAITKFAGSMVFIYIHVVIFGVWIVVNVGPPIFVPRWDPSLVVLAMAASVEAIFLSTFVLISQNRMAAEDDKRADLNLQISLLNEHETTKLIALVSAIAQRLEVHTEIDAEVPELEEDVAPEAVLDRLAAMTDGREP